MSAPFKGSRQERIDVGSIPEPNSGCWLWIESQCGPGADRDKGYGYIKWRRKSGRAHRFSWETYRGTIPNGMHVLHRCDNRPCVNPDHLFLGTNLDNVKDKMTKGRHVVTPIYGSRQGNAKLTETQVIAIRASFLSGRELARAYSMSEGVISQIRSRQIWKHI